MQYLEVQAELDRVEHALRFARAQPTWRQYLETLEYALS